MRRALFAGTAALSIAAPAFAYAQPAPPAAPTSLQEVVVTAQRREENLQKAALAVQAVSGQQLSRAGVTQPEDLAKLVPALQIVPAAGPYTLFYLRGVGNFNGNALSDSAVAFNLDNVYVARPSSASGVFYDVDRIEVLKGPQGTLYGRNATGGAINVLTKDPGHAYSADGELELGDYSKVRVSGDLNAPLSDQVAIRGAFQIVSHDGYLKDGLDDERSQAGRVKIRFDASPDVRIVVGADYAHEGGRGVGASILTGQDQFLGGDPWLGNTSPAAQALYSHTLDFTAGNFLSALPGDSQAAAHCAVYAQNHSGACPLNNATPFQDNTFWGTYANLTWSSPLGTLTLIPAYRRSSIDFMSPEAGFRIDQRETDEQTSFEARFASKTDQPLRYLVGLYYLHEGISSDPSYDQEYNFSTEHLALKTDTVAGFGRLTWALTDTFRLTGGVRYTWEKKQGVGSYLTMATLCPGAFIPPPFGPQFCFGGVGQVDIPAAPITLNQSKTWSRATWRGAAEWDVTPSSLLYASVETGFKSGGFSMSATYPSYQPETITAWTVGSKNRFFDNRVQLNLEGFWWKYRNQQISHLTYDANGTIVFPTQNVGLASIKGVEGELQVLVTPTTLVGADIQYLDSTYDSFVYSVPYFGAPPTSACPFTVQPGPPVVAVLNCSGMTAPQSPKWTVNLNARQTIPLGALSLVAEIQTHYQSATLTGLEFLPVEVQRPAWTTDFSLTLEGPGRHWTLTGYVRNVENSAVVTATFLQPLVGAALPNGSVKPPRTFGAILGIHF